MTRSCGSTAASLIQKMTCFPTTPIAAGTIYQTDLSLLYQCMTAYGSQSKYGVASGWHRYLMTKKFTSISSFYRKFVPTYHCWFEYEGQADMGLATFLETSGVAELTHLPENPPLSFDLEKLRNICPECFYLTPGSDAVIAVSIDGNMAHVRFRGKVLSSKKPSNRGCGYDTATPSSS